MIDFNIIILLTDSSSTRVTSDSFNYNSLQNSGFSLLRTFASVSPLLSENVEWIIADGLSNDCSVDCLRVISFFNSPFIHIFNQRDVSIYDAMNKASAYASGRFVVFINSGDCIIGDSFSKFVAQIPCDDIITVFSYCLVDSNFAISKPPLFKCYLQYFFPFRF